MMYSFVYAFVKERKLHKTICPAISSILPSDVDAWLFGHWKYYTGDLFILTLYLVHETTNK